MKSPEATFRTREYISDKTGLDPARIRDAIASPTCKDTASWIDLSAFENSAYDPGRGILTRLLWYFVSLVLFESGWFPVMGPKRFLLRLFGARIGHGLILKPHVRIKYPWRLVVGDHCWIGQGAWIDNLATVQLGNHVCLSQGSYLCTGSHDYCRRTFDLITRPIRIENGVWVAANATILGGVLVGCNTVVAAGSIVVKDVPPQVIVAGSPASILREREPPAAQ